MLVILAASFFYGWYADNSKPQAGKNWADQGVYEQYSENLASGNLPTPGDLVYSFGYPAMGVLGGLVDSGNRFMAVSLLLLLASAVFCFLAVRHMFGALWATIFSALLFYWDGFARDLHYSSELFAIPWNNQVLFFAFAFYFWLLVTKLNAVPSYKLVAAVGFISGLTFATREETVLFMAPMLAGFLFFSKAGWCKWLAGFAVMGLAFLPQVAIKQAVLGSVTKTSGRPGISETLTDRYFRVDYFVRNINEVILDSDHYDSTATSRDALLQEAWWLWLAPAGLLLAMFSRGPPGLKFFVLASVGVMLFYLSGYNMSAIKLSFHCLRYISPGFIALNLGVVVILRAMWQILPKILSKIGYLWRVIKSLDPLIHALPFVIPIFFALSGLFIITLLLVDSLENLIVWPGLALILIVSFIFVRRYTDRITLPGSHKEKKLIGLMAFLFVFAWLAVNVKYTAQHVYVNRDPGIYTVTAAELLDADTLRLDQQNIFDSTEGVTDASFGFGDDVKGEHSLYAQGTHLLPALIGLTGRIVGRSAMLHLNPLIGAAALLTFYGFVRIFMRPRWALLATVAISLSLPFIYFSRDTYTEPLAMLFTFGGLGTLWLAQANKSRLLWLVAGLVIGAGALARIDGYIVIAAIFGYAALYLLTRPDKQLREGGAYVFCLSAGLVIASLVGWLDLSQLSSGYYRDLSTQISRLMMLLAASVSGLVVVLLVRSKTRFFKWVDESTRAWRSYGIVATVAAICAFLVSRPLWFKGYGKGSARAFVGGLQAASGAVVDGARSYSEITFNWNVWYIGPILAVLGLVGYAIVAKFVSHSHKKTEVWGPVLMVVFISMVIYFVKPSIIPDQIWASRRMLPVIMPGLVFFGVFTLSWLISKQKISITRLRIVWIMLLISIFTPILYVSYPFLRTREETPLLSQVNDICNVLPEKAVVLWYGRMGDIATQSTEAFCNKPAVKIKNVGQANLEIAYQEATAKGYRPVIGVKRGELQELGGGQRLTLVSDVSFARLGQTLEHPPREVNMHGSAVLIGELGSDGTIAGLDR